MAPGRAQDWGSCFRRKSACPDQQNSDWRQELLARLSPAPCGSHSFLTLTPRLRGAEEPGVTPAPRSALPASTCAGRGERRVASPPPPRLLTLPLKGFILPMRSLSCLAADSAPRPAQEGGGSLTPLPSLPRPAVKTPASPCMSSA